MSVFSIQKYVKPAANEIYSHRSRNLHLFYCGGSQYKEVKVQFSWNDEKYSLGVVFFGRMCQFSKVDCIRYLPVS